MDRIPVEHDSSGGEGTGLGTRVGWLDDHARRSALDDSRQVGAWLLSPSTIQNAIGFCVATYPFYDPLAHGVEKIFAAEWDGCMSLVVQGTVGRIGGAARFWRAAPSCVHVG